MCWSMFVRGGGGGVKSGGDGGDDDEVEDGVEGEADRRPGTAWWANHPPRGSGSSSSEPIRGTCDKSVLAAYLELRPWSSSSSSSRRYGSSSSSYSSLSLDRRKWGSSSSSMWGLSSVVNEKNIG